MCCCAVNIAGGPTLQVVPEPTADAGYVGNRATGRVGLLVLYTYDAHNCGRTREDVVVGEAELGPKEGGERKRDG